jgi:hypothetical protein
MGGLRSRAIIADPSNKDAENFGKGEVRKFAALTSPQHGSPFANMVINVHRQLSDAGNNHSGLLNRFERIVNAAGGNVHRGAICDLADNSPALAYDTQTDVRSMAFVSSYGPEDRWQLLLNLALKVSTVTLDELLSGTSVKQDEIDIYVFHGPNDTVVDVPSQLAGLPEGGNFSNYPHSFIPLCCIGVTLAPEVADTIYEKLDHSDGWANYIPGFSPSQAGAVPRLPVVGKGLDQDGNWIDAENFRLQCETDVGGMGPPLLRPDDQH